MPCMTPVWSRGPPERRARMRDSLGPVLSRTPRISTWKSSILLPEKMVRPVPCMPARMSLRGKIWAEAEKTADTARAARSANRGTNWRTILIVYGAGREAFGDRVGGGEAAGARRFWGNEAD